ncbi:hypothetical protein ACSBLW_04865 [Thioclava sp. FR2]
MTDRLSLILGGLIVAAIVLDLSVNGGQALFFLSLRLAELIEWIAFWR